MATETVVINIFLGVGIEKIADNKPTIYQNPAVNRFKVCGIKGEAEVRILNLIGTEIANRSNVENETVSVENFPKGNFLVIISNDNKSQVIKLIKK